jgi:V8-like Glu-specific endopeptidase
MQVDVGRGNETLLGTGFVVTVNDAPYILTAAHNFVHQDKVNGKISEATHAEFFLARNGEYTYGRKFVVSSFLVHPKYYSHADPEDGYDIAIAAVEKPHLLEPSLASLPAIWLEADHADDWESMQNVKRKIDRSSCIAWFGRLREREKVNFTFWRTMQGLADDATACERILWFRGWADYWSGRETLWQDTDSFMVAGYPGEESKRYKQFAMLQAGAKNHGTVIRHHVHTTGGMSGSPLVRYQSSGPTRGYCEGGDRSLNASAVLVGVHVAGDHVSNIATPIDKSRHDWIVEAVRQL